MTAPKTRPAANPPPGLLWPANRRYKPTMMASGEAALTACWMTASFPLIMMPVRLLVNYRMERMSDERLMLLSSAKKLVMGTTFDELALESTSSQD